MKKLFGGINLTWSKLIIFAIIVGVYTAIMAILPITKETSFRDITATFEVWILFGILIIMNSKSPKDSALKCFVFFLISQPLIYLLQVPFSYMGWKLFGYYKYWFIWTLFTIPMGYIGYYIKKDKWWGILILTPILVLLGLNYYNYLGEAISFFPNHLLTTLFCIATMILYPLALFKDKKNKYIGVIISAIIILVSSFIVISNGRTSYNTSILVSHGSENITFDDSYKVYLRDENYGKVYITYEKNIEDYIVNAEFIKLGKTEFILESPDGNKTTFDIEIKRNTYDLTRK